MTKTGGDDQQPDDTADPAGKASRHDKASPPTPPTGKTSPADGDTIAELGDELGGPV